MPRLIEALPSDCLVSYLGHLLEESYPSAVGLFCSPSRLSQVQTKFSTSNNVFTKKCNLLQTKKKILSAEIFAILTLKQIVAKDSVISSQDLVFPLHFVFVNKMYFLLNENYACPYVDLKFLRNHVWVSMKKRLRNTCLEQGSNHRTLEADRIHDGH